MLKTERVRKEYNRLREKVFAQDVMSFQERRSFLARAIRTPAGELHEGSDIAQEVTISEGKDGTTKRIKALDKVRCLELDAKLAGDFDKDVQVVNPFALIIQLGKTPAQTSLMDDARQAVSVGQLPHPPVIDAELVSD